MSEQKDWRIGLTVRPKYRNHPLYYERGIVEAVLPSGTNLIADKDGVLRIRMDSGTVYLGAADDWVTA